MPWRADDEPEVVTGVRERATPNAGRSSMLRQWYNIVGEAVEEHGGILTVGYPVFNKHIRELREFHSDEEILAGFERFAGLVGRGKIQVRSKPAWLVFYGRRATLVRRAVVPKKLPAKKVARSPFDIERSPKPSFKR